MSSPEDSSPSTLRPQPGEALLIVDVQTDFLPGGALAVPHGGRVVPVLNRLLDEFSRCGLPIVATRDWHPPDHCSFNTQGGRWPPHCVRGTAGAEFAAELRLPADAHFVSKATRTDHEQYSAFAEGDLADWLRQRGVRRLYVGGLATEYCVLAGVRDALQQGFDVVVLTEAIGAVDERDGEAALREMQRLGAVLV